MELLRALAVFAEPPVPETAHVAALLGLEAPSPAEFADVFLFQLPPYAAIYLGADGQLGGEAQDRVAGFYRALGIAVDREPDHLTTLLGAYAGLLEAEASGRTPGGHGGPPSKEHREPLAGALPSAPNLADPADRIRQARTALLFEHLVSWLPAYLSAVRRLAPPPLVRWASLLDAVLRAEVRAVPSPAALPLHLRVAAGLPSPEDGASVWLDALLAPARSGMILTRADLARGARDLGLGLRAGERRFALRALLEQSPGPVLSWLAGEAEASSRRHEDEGADWPGLAADWARRAATTARTLRKLSIEERSHA